jgi:LacI family transcriptional regulator
VSKFVTLADVAEAAGVSLATASRALNGSPNRHVREDLRRRVLSAAQELNYSLNTQAQAVARGRTSVVGLIVHDVADPYFSSIAAGVMRQAEKHGLIVTMATTSRDPAREVEHVRILRSQRARALVMAGTRFADSGLLGELESELSMYESAGGRVAMISQRRLPVDTVVVENRAGARALAEALHGLGHRRFGVLAAPSQVLTSKDRVAGFREAAARRGCQVPREHVFTGAFTRDGGYEAMSRLLERQVDVTCVFAANDVMAVGAMAAARDHGVALPREMAVAGFDDIATLRDITPGLTTVRLPLEDMGAQALEMTMGEPPAEPRIRRVSGEVIVRESTPAIALTG